MRIGNASTLCICRRWSVIIIIHYDWFTFDKILPLHQIKSVECTILTKQVLVVGSCEIWCDLMHLLESNGLTGMRLYASIHKYYSIFEGSKNLNNKYFETRKCLERSTNISFFLLLFAFQGMAQGINIYLELSIISTFYGLIYLL